MKIAHLLLYRAVWMILLFRPKMAFCWRAYKNARIPFETHLFESCNGVHGVSICEKETLYENETVKTCLQLSKNWLDNRGFMIK